MPVFQLTDELLFPHPSYAREDGLLAVGGDLSCQRLLLAYNNGIFPWYNEGQPILWWSPNPRFILLPDGLKVSGSMKKFLRKNIYTVTFDTDFRGVITACGQNRSDGTWITHDMIESYCALHELGYAHSVEVRFEGKLVGGLYGICLGNCFFGESMFSQMDNASKTALITLNNTFNFSMIDCQVYSKHLESLGAINVDRDSYLELLRRGLKHYTKKGKWSFIT
jgi:leucyl/phenylalanyl-tRNA--protein transferase